MSKVLKTSNLSQRPAIRTLFAISFCASIVAFGCTTDRNVANGDPVVTPGLRTSPTGGMSTGSESASVPPPMMSSSRVSASDAAAIMAQHQSRVRILGLAWPGNGGRPYASDPTISAKPVTPYTPSTPAIANDAFSANVVEGIPIDSTVRNAQTTNTAANLANAVRVINANGRIKISNQ